MSQLADTGCGGAVRRQVIARRLVHHTDLALADEAHRRSKRRALGRVEEALQRGVAGVASPTMPQVDDRVRNASRVRFDSWRLKADVDAIGRALVRNDPPIRPCERAPRAVAAQRALLHARNGERRGSE